jgi:hypothetical protein
MKVFPYKSLFASITLKPLVSREKDQHLAVASLQELRRFLPDVEIASVDLLPVAFNACVVNRVNKNQDVIDTTTALAMYKSFITKPINVEHNRQKVIGVITNAGFSEFGTDQPLSEEQVRGMTVPFNITLGGYVWRVVCPELSDFIEESNDPTSPHYQGISASWELGFSDYRIALMDGGVKNLAQAKRIISEPQEVETLKSNLVVNEGKGKIDDLFAYRMPSYDVLALGIGFTEKPAAEVKGVATPQATELTAPQKEVFSKECEASEHYIEKCSCGKVIGQCRCSTENKVVKITENGCPDCNKNKNNFSQSTETHVKIERKQLTMKIASLADITTENLKHEAAASAVSEFIAAELKKGDITFQEEKGKLNKQLEEAKQASAKAQEEQEKLKVELEKVQKTVEALSNEKVEREKVEKFNARMGEVSQAYELDDEARAAIVEDIRAIASDEDFEKWKSKAKVLLKGYAKKSTDALAAEKAQKEKEAQEAAASEAKAKEDAAKAAKEKEKQAAAAVSSAIDNADKEKGGLPNGSSASSQSLLEKYRNAFAKENLIITR